MNEKNYKDNFDFVDSNSRGLLTYEELLVAIDRIRIDSSEENVRMHLIGIVPNVPKKEYYSFILF